MIELADTPDVSTLARIGILGGMGPAATAALMIRIIALTPARHDADHVPLIVDNNPHVPSRIEALIDDSGMDPGPVLAAMARNLEAQGAVALAMPCNAAHGYAPAIAQAVSIPLLNMVELAVTRVIAALPQGGQVGILAAPVVESSGIFERAFADTGITTRYAKTTGLVLDTVRRIKANSADMLAAHNFVKLATGLEDAGADVVLVACSEFSLVTDALPEAFPAMDTLEMLAEACVAFAGGVPKSRVRRAWSLH